MQIRTARLILAPVTGADFADLLALKSDPRSFAQMLGGVRSVWQVQDELAADIADWAMYRVGMFTLREGDKFQGIAGLHRRADGRGQALRFAVWHDARGRGLAREAAGAALRDAHGRAGLRRVVAVARADNVGSRLVLGAIGMREREIFMRRGLTMVMYESAEDIAGE